MARTNGTESSAALPAHDSPSLTLVHPTMDEMRGVWKLNSKEWASALSLEDYIERELYLASRSATKDGGILFWALVESQQPVGKRRLLCTFETLRRRALVNTDGEVKEGTAYGIASVFCAPEFRGNKYASRALKEYAQLLRRVNAGEQVKSLEPCLFSTLFSDIGKKFYTALGWNPYPSSHLELRPQQNTFKLAGLTASPIRDEDIPGLCDADEELLREHLGRKGAKTQAVVIPDPPLIDWQHGREDFLSAKLLNKDFSVRGVGVTGEDGGAAWCIWARVYTSGLNKDSTPKGYLAVLRLVYDETDAKSPEMVKVLLAACQNEAHSLNLDNVQYWNPSELVLKAGQALTAWQLGKNEATKEVLIHREESAVPSLMWFGKDTDGDQVSGKGVEVELLGNEKYAWC